MDSLRVDRHFSELTNEKGTGFTPFRWQRRFLKTLIEGGPPSVVDIPTGLGKTSVMALWLIALAEGASLPRRLVYVVDRRAVVDQATRFAEQLRRNLPADLADGLQIKAGAGGLAISTLRGGFADNRDWLEDPTKPAIIVGTIDMIGSRLLFEGYGVSRRMRPYHAGFLGVDTLVLLDEAHLVPPFEELLRQIANQRDGEFGPRQEGESITPPFRLMSLSATGRDTQDTSPELVFRLEEQDSEEHIVRRRMRARKRLKVIRLEKKELLARSLAERALDLGIGDDPGRVVVYCNSRKDAVEVKKQIDGECARRARSGILKARCISELLIGERRVYERSALEGWLEKSGFLGGFEHARGSSAFLIATSAGEVGVDLDADHMVCDLVAYERMVQRLGRVNRRGGEERSAIIEVFAPEPPKPQANASNAKRKDYKRALARHKQQLAPLRQLPLGEDGRRDASPLAMANLKRERPKVVNDATTRPPLYPRLTRPLIDAWAMTSLERHEGRPEVAPWLRGWEKEDEPQTEVVWRKYLPVAVRGDNISISASTISMFFRAAPIHATEKLEAGSIRVLDWLLKRVRHIERRSWDEAHAVRDEEIVAILLDRAGDYLAHVTLSELLRLGKPAKSFTAVAKRNRDRRKEEWKSRLLPGSLLVLDARIGGLSDGMLDEKSTEEVPVADFDEHWQQIRQDAYVAQSPPLLGFRVDEVTADDNGEGLAAPVERQGWRHARTFETHRDSEGAARRGLAVFKHAQSETDEHARSIAAVEQSLSEHAEQAAARACEFATRLELPKEEIDAITLAARLHDDGKAAPRWQNAMNAPPDGRPYAKTRGGGDWRLLEGYRHEFGSLLKAEARDLPESARDLVLHLIAAHHGRSRPVISSAGCDDGPPSALESRAGEAALRFIRLQNRFGPWGLAWREAILRAADQIVSKELSMAKGGQCGG